MGALGSLKRRLELPRKLDGLNPSATQGGGVVQPFPPPTGYRWEHVFEGTDPVYENNERVVELIRTAA